MRLRWRLHVSYLSYAWRWIIVTCFFASIYVVLNMSTERTSADLEREITRLSVYYVRALAKERGLHASGTAAGGEGVNEADLQRTMSVLLHSMLTRVTQLEHIVANNFSVSPSSTLNVQSDIGHPAGARRRHGPGAAVLRPNASVSLHAAQVKAERQHFQAFLKYNRLRGLVKRLGGHCELPLNWQATHLECENKMDWMSRFHTSDPCYSRYGVSDDPCSALVYLSEVETFCPRNPRASPELAHSPDSAGPLAAFLVHAPAAITARVRLSWPHWRAAALRLQRSRPAVARHRAVLYPALAHTASPLEALMWADLAAGLYALGHTVLWVHSRERLRALIAVFPEAGGKSSCQAKMNIFLSLIYVDEAGLGDLRRLLPDGAAARFACVVRVVRPEGAIHERVQPHDGLTWRQYATAYPTLDDHTFLGFAVRRHERGPDPHPRRLALVVGSSPAEFAGAGRYLQAVAQHFAVHTLLPSAEEARQVSQRLGMNVSNHAEPSLDSPRLRRLLRSAAVVVGLGRPLDPALALLGIAHGAVFLNPSLRRPLLVPANRTGGLTVRSQHSYLARHVGPPWALPVDTGDLRKLDVLLRRLKGAQLAPHVPLEFSHFGYLQRLKAYLKEEDICSLSKSSQPDWPPPDSVDFYLAVRGDNCEVTCRKKDLKCEPSYFQVINSRTELEERSIRCLKANYDSNPGLPAFEPVNKACHFQAEPRKYSCFHPPASSLLLRVCPCRNYLRGQLGLCKTCL